MNEICEWYAIFALQEIIIKVMSVVTLLFGLLKMSQNSIQYFLICTAACKIPREKEQTGVFH